MERARAAFQNKGLKLTPLRQSVFREIAASHKAIGAYEVLDRLAARGERLAPISVYRAIEALVAAGIVHRFESRNAFFACHAGHEMRQLVLACEACGRVAEVDADKVFAAIDKSADVAGFSAKGAVVEVGGCAQTVRARGGGLRMEAPRVQEQPTLREPASHQLVASDHDHHDHDHPEIDAPALAHDADALFSARSLWLARSGRAILQGVDIDIAQGEILTLIGPNGAGKTTLVRVLLGLEAPDKGTIQRKAGLVVGYVPQRFEVDRAIPLTVDRFVQLGRRAEDEEIERALADVGAGKLGDRQLSELSGGELQRVVLARALVGSPGILVLDEPVRGIDYAGEAELYTLIGRLRSERGFGVLLVSHDLHVVMAQSDRVICLNRHVCCSGVPQSVAQHPEYARLFGPQAARAFALYHHHHDHRHDLAGEPQTPAPRERTLGERA